MTQNGGTPKTLSATGAFDWVRGEEYLPARNGPSPSEITRAAMDAARPQAPAADNTNRSDLNAVFTQSAIGVVAGPAAVGLQVAQKIAPVVQALIP